MQSNDLILKENLFILISKLLFFIRKKTRNLQKSLKKNFQSTKPKRAFAEKKEFPENESSSKWTSQREQKLKIRLSQGKVLF